MSATFLEKSSAGRVGSRMGRDLRMLMQFEPALAGLALWVKFADVEDDSWAYTDGTCVYAGPKYETLSEPHRIGVVLHELLHVGLAHPARFLRMSLAEGPSFDRVLANVAADAIINASIRVITAPYKTRVSLPDFGINLTSVLKEHGLPHAGLPEGEAVSKWSLEGLYAALKTKNAEAGEGSLTVGLDVREADSGAQDGEAAATRGTAADGDEALRQEIEGWNKRVTTMWGSVPGMAETLVGDIPKVPTPWEPMLRAYLMRALGKPGRTNWSKPSRRWTSLESTLMREEGIRLPFEPARDYPKKSGRIAVAVDTSGSISDSLLHRFTGEIAAIMRQTNSTVLMLTADTKVNFRTVLKGVEGEKQLRNFRYMGRGGTSFVDAIEEMAAWKPDVAIYLTDLEGACGSAPAFPLIWALVPGYNRTTAPFGRVVNLQ